MSARLIHQTSSCRHCPFYQGGREQSCTAIAGSMRCSVHEIEHYCVGDAHPVCPVYQQRLRMQQDVPVELYEDRLVAIEFQQAGL